MSTSSGTARFGFRSGALELSGRAAGCGAVDGSGATAAGAAAVGGTSDFTVSGGAGACARASAAARTVVRIARAIFNPPLHPVLAPAADFIASSLVFVFRGRSAHRPSLQSHLVVLGVYP